MLASVVNASTIAQASCVGFDLSKGGIIASFSIRAMLTPSVVGRASLGVPCLGNGSVALRVFWAVLFSPSPSRLELAWRIRLASLAPSCNEPTTPPGVSFALTAVAAIS